MKYDLITIPNLSRKEMVDERWVDAFTVPIPVVARTERTNITLSRNESIKELLQMDTTVMETGRTAIRRRDEARSERLISVPVVSIKLEFTIEVDGEFHTSLEENNKDGLEPSGADVPRTPVVSEADGNIPTQANDQHDGPETSLSGEDQQVSAMCASLGAIS